VVCYTGGGVKGKARGSAYARRMLRASGIHVPFGVGQRCAAYVRQVRQKARQQGKNRYARRRARQEKVARARRAPQRPGRWRVCVGRKGSTAAMRRGRGRRCSAR